MGTCVKRIVVLASRLAELVRRALGTLARRFARIARGAGRRVQGAAARLASAARDPHGFLRKFLVSLAIAIGIDAALHLMHGRPWLTRIEDDAMDWAIGLYRGATPSRERLVPFTLVEIDDATFDAWEAPPYIPRDRLATLVRAIAALEPAVLVVDIDLSGRAEPEADEELADLLRQHGQPEAATRVAPVILARSFRRGDGQWQPRASFLDPVVEANPHLHLASCLFEREVDWEIRRWRLWESLCTESDGAARVEVVPSIQLLAAAVVLTPGASLQELVSSLTREVTRSGGDPCTDEAANSHGSHSSGGAQGVVRIGDLELRVPPERVGQRIVFRYAAREALGPDERYPRDPRTGQELLSVVSALPISEAGAPLSPELFAGRIVVIGGSFHEGRDLHRTPLGPMPGALVIINAIDSLLEYGEIQPPSPLAKWLVILTTVLAMSLVFARFDSTTGPIVAGGLILLVLLPSSVLLFKDGYWVDFGVPLLSVWIHRSAARIHERLEARAHSQQERSS